MTQFVSLSFTLKGQELEAIKTTIAKLSAELHERHECVILVHGFMPKDVVIEKGFSLEVVHCLKEHFPHQIEFYKEGDLEGMRKRMAAFLKQNKGCAYVIGDATGGVADEIDHYLAAGVQVHGLPLLFDDMIPAKNCLTYGQKLAGVDFNPSGNKNVREIKELTAKLIDLIANLKSAHRMNESDQITIDLDKISMFNQSISYLQAAQMFAVKAETWSY